MSKNYSKKRRLKYVLLALTCTATFSMTGLAAACAPEQEDEDNTTATTREDLQLLKNGNFEFFNVPEKEKDGNEPVYLINTPNNWTHGGTSSYTMSGIVDTNKSAWDKLEDKDLASKLDKNNALKTGDSNYKQEYIDYNGMKSSDILYKDSYAALNYKEDDKENEGKEDPRENLVANPKTHHKIEGSDSTGYYYMDGGEKVTVYKDSNGDYFLKYDAETGEYSETFTNVLMLHNYSNSTHNGIEQNYSSVSIDLPVNTAAEVTVWVKTVNLLYNQGEEAIQDRGAYISVAHTVGGTSLDDFKISNINTEQLIKNESVADDYNGWVQYTVYINACDFASTSVTLKLGLGEMNALVEGYAFFDDVKVTKYVNLDDEDCTYSENADKIGKAHWALNQDVTDKVFKTDSYERNNGAIKDERFSKNFHYLLDLASQNAAVGGYAKFDIANAKNLKTGLTVDADDYVSSKNFDVRTSGSFTQAEASGNAKLPDALKNIKVNGVAGTGIDTSNDLLALVKANHEFRFFETNYYEKLNSAIESVENLPNGAATDNVLVMLSARGAAYTTSFDLSVQKEGYKILSFWIKTSDMGGGTAATIKLIDKNNDDNTATLTVDTTDKVTDIDDNHPDIYNGWVQCFFFVHNDDTVSERELTLEVSFGNTNVNGTTLSNFKAGWAALANLQTLDVNEETFSYTSTGDYAASLTLSEDDEKATSSFDEVYGNQAHEIENSIVTPSSYNGVNGASSSVVTNGQSSFPFDNFNTNANAGLINKKYVNNYADKDWYTNLLTSFNKNNWEDVFGQKSVQPLVILNGYRYIEKEADEKTFKDLYVENNGTYTKVADSATYDKDTTYYVRVMNYGFIGDSKTISANTYSTVSVRVKVSSGAKAYIYLVDTAAGKPVLNFTTPLLSYYYDEDGNVLKAERKADATLSEQRANVLYTLRKDGLYEDEYGQLRANVYNYKKVYKDESLTYYDKDKNVVRFEDLVDGKEYYISDGVTLANHFLTTNSGESVYEYYNGKYYYIVNGKTTATEVLPFAEEYARYDNRKVSEDYTVEIDGTNPDVADKWITVNFVIHTGSESKTYRLELWSGERGSLDSGAPENSSVLFDHSYTSVSNDDLKGEYENEIIKAYQRLLADKNLLSSIPTSAENIAYYENLVDGLVKDNKLTKDEVDAVRAAYKAYYYTFSLYDSASFVPFNSEVAAEGTQGYNYTLSNYSETLAYLSVTGEDEYTVFADYSAIDQSVDFIKADDDNDDDGDDKDDNTNVWLLVSSILLVVALLFAMLAIMIKDLLKKSRRTNVTAKNNYDHNKAKRHTKKAKAQPEEVVEAEPVAETEVEPEPVEEPVNEPEVESEPAEEEAPSAEEKPEDGQE